MILLTGETFPTLYLAIFFELLWLDLIPVGTFIPPNAIFSLVASVLLMHFFQLEGTGELFLLVLLTLPGAYLMARLEGWERVRQNRNYNLILRQSRDKWGNFQPEKMIWRSLAGSLANKLAGASIGIYLLSLIFPLLNNLLVLDPKLDWHHLILASSISGLAALRVKKAYASLIMGMTLIVLFLIWQQWIGIG